MTLVVGILVASLLGSVHCAAMCGAFTCLYSPADATRTWHTHASYNGGRLVSYVLLGALAGVAGARVNDVGHLAGVGQLAAVVAGVLMILWAGSAIGATVGLRVPVTLAPEWARRFIGQLLVAGRDRRPAARAMLIGLLTTLLPCGWLYTFVVVAGGTGSALAGAGVMMAFWVGTVPALVVIGAGAARLFGPMRRRLPVVSATVVLVLGLLSIAGKLHPPAIGQHAHMSGVHADR